MKTAVMTDSNSGITPEEGKKIGIYSLPMPVIIEGDVFYEGKNITQEEYYGAMTPVTQMAAVSVAEARVLVIQPWDKSTLKPIEKAIQASDIGINPQNDGSVIRLTFPQLTEDRRKELVKDIKKMGEECKVAIRSIRRDAMEKFKAMKKNNEITEDDLKDCEDEIQKLTDRFVKEVDGHVAEKEKEILSI